MDFDGFNLRFGFIQVLFAGFSILFWLALLAVLALLVRFLIIATKAAQLYLRRNEPPRPAPHDPAPVPPTGSPATAPANAPAVPPAPAARGAAQPAAPGTPPPAPSARAIRDAPTVRLSAADVPTVRTAPADAQTESLPAAVAVEPPKRTLRPKKQAE
jgi:predicted lipid-binding transport protein (Tim44 family)